VTALFTRAKSLHSRNRREEERITQGKVCFDDMEGTTLYELLLFFQCNIRPDYQLRAEEGRDEGQRGAQMCVVEI
jgi:hypothetical protein